jgi:hypothetical protein
MGLHNFCAFWGEYLLRMLSVSSFKSVTYVTLSVYILLTIFFLTVMGKMVNVKVSESWARGLVLIDP